MVSGEEFEVQSPLENEKTASEEKNDLSGWLTKGAASLKKSAVKMCKFMKSRTMRTNDSARSDAPAESHCSFDDAFPVALLSGFLSLPDSVSNVEKKWLDDVCMSPHFCQSGTFEKYDAIFPFYRPLQSLEYLFRNSFKDKQCYVLSSSD